MGTVRHQNRLKERLRTIALSTLLAIVPSIFTAKGAVVDRRSFLAQISATGFLSGCVPSLDPRLKMAVIPSDVWDPYQGCPSFRPGPIQTKWVLQAVALIVYLSDAYKKIRDNVTDYNALLNAISQSLDEIKKQVEEVNAKLDQLTDYIHTLPKLIRGEIDASIASFALGECAGILGHINDHSAKDRIDTDYPIVDRYAEDLATKISGIIGVQGLGASIIVAPYLTGWLNARVLVEKTRRRLDPTYIIRSPWRDTFLNDSHNNFSGLFSSIDTQDGLFRHQIIPKMPFHRSPLKVDVSDDFVWTGRPAQWGDYRITCPSTFKPERLQRAELDLPQPPGPPPIPGGGMPIKWLDVDLVDPAYKKGAVALTRYIAARSEITAFYNAMPEIMSLKSDTMNVFVEPQGFSTSLQSTLT